MPSFPNLGRGKFFDSEDEELAALANETDFSNFNTASESTMILDKLANPHNRFPTLMRNIRERRGLKVDIRVPVFQDSDTKETEVHMYAMHFGMG